MVYSDVTNKSGILQDCEFWVFGGDYGAITNSSLRIDEFTRLCNRALDEIASTLLNTDTSWQWDDANRTDFPEVTTDLIAGQAAYTLERENLKPMGFEILDKSGDYYPIYEVDYNDLKRRGISMTEYRETNGKPESFDLKGNTVYLYPAPTAESSTLVDGLKCIYQRGFEYFTSSDTTREPGFPSIYHQLVSLYAARYYCATKEMNNKYTIIVNEIERVESQLEKHMATRNATGQNRVTVRSNLIR